MYNGRGYNQDTMIGIVLIAIYLRIEARKGR